MSTRVVEDAICSQVPDVILLLDSLFQEAVRNSKGLKAIKKLMSLAIATIDMANHQSKNQSSNELIKNALLLKKKQSFHRSSLSKRRRSQAACEGTVLLAEELKPSAAVTGGWALLKTSSVVCCRRFFVLFCFDDLLLKDML